MSVITAEMLKTSPYNVKTDNNYADARNNTVGIKNAIYDALNNQQAAGKVVLPDGIIHIDDTLLIQAYLDFGGQGRATVLYQRQAGVDVIKLFNTQHFNIHDFAFASDADNTNGIHLVASHSGTISRLSTRGVASNALLLENAINNTIEDVRQDLVDIPGLSGTIKRPQRGLLIDEYQSTPSVMNRIMSCYFTAYIGQGIRIINASSNTIICCGTQGNFSDTGYGVYIDGPQAFCNTFINHYFEPGSFQAAAKYDMGNKTRWINPQGLNEPGIDWAQYGQNRYFTLP